MLASKTQQQRRQGEQRVMNENSTKRQHDIGEIKLAGVQDAPLTQSHGRQGGVASGRPGSITRQIAPGTDDTVGKHSIQQVCACLPMCVCVCVLLNL